MTSGPGFVKYRTNINTIKFYMVIYMYVFLLVKKMKLKYIESHLFICSQSGSVFGTEEARGAQIERISSNREY